MKKIKTWFGAWWGGWLVGILDFVALLIVVCIFVAAFSITISWMSDFIWEQVAVPTVLFAVAWTILRVTTACIHYRTKKDEEREKENCQKITGQQQIWNQTRKN